MIYEATVCKVLQFPAKATNSIPPRPSLFASLQHAKQMLAARTMGPDDVRAWLDLDDLQRELPARKIRQCEAAVGGGENPPQCPNQATQGFFCPEHTEE